MNTNGNQLPFNFVGTQQSLSIPMPTAIATAGTCMEPITNNNNSGGSNSSNGKAATATGGSTFWSPTFAVDHLNSARGDAPLVDGRAPLPAESSAACMMPSFVPTSAQSSGAGAGEALPSHSPHRILNASGQLNASHAAPHLSAAAVGPYGAPNNNSGRAVAHTAASSNADIGHLTVPAPATNLLHLAVSSANTNSSSVHSVVAPAIGGGPIDPSSQVIPSAPNGTLADLIPAASKQSSLQQLLRQQEHERLSLLQQREEVAEDGVPVPSHQGPISKEGIITGEHGSWCSANIFVANIPSFWTEELLRDHYSPYGTVVSVKAVPSRRFGFVRFATVEEAQRAIIETDKKRPTPGLSLLLHVSMAVHDEGDGTQPNNRIFVRGLPEWATDQLLHDAVRPFAAPNKCSILVDGQRRCKGTAFVEFDTIEEATKLMDAAAHVVVCGGPTGERIGAVGASDEAKQRHMIGAADASSNPYSPAPSYSFVEALEFKYSEPSESRLQRAARNKERVKKHLNDKVRTQSALLQQQHHQQQVQLAQQLAQQELLLRQQQQQQFAQQQQLMGMNMMMQQHAGAMGGLQMPHMDMAGHHQQMPMPMHQRPPAFDGAYPLMQQQQQQPMGTAAQPPHYPLPPMGPYGPTGHPQPMQQQQHHQQQMAPPAAQLPFYMGGSNGQQQQQHISQNAMIGNGSFSGGNNSYTGAIGGGSTTSLAFGGFNNADFSRAAAASNTSYSYDAANRGPYGSPFGNAAAPNANAATAAAGVDALANSNNSNIGNPLHYINNAQQQQQPVGGSPAPLQRGGFSPQASINSFVQQQQQGHQLPMPPTLNNNMNNNNKMHNNAHMLPLGGQQNAGGPAGAAFPQQQHHQQHFFNNSNNNNGNHFHNQQQQQQHPHQAPATNGGSVNNNNGPNHFFGNGGLPKGDAPQHQLQQQQQIVRMQDGSLGIVQTVNTPNGPAQVVVPYSQR